jgi:hypothetical protein
MTGPRFDADTLAAALTTKRWNVLAKTGLDPATIGTWDSNLHRRKRVCVPVDVQAFVVPAAGGEPTLRMFGDSRDPAPFSAGSVRASGVHLHWALPDSLLTGEPTTRDAEGQSDELALQALPDRWVVLRMLRPRGVKRALVRGWVIDARLKAVAPLETFAGTFTGADSEDALDRLDAGFGGSLLWTASYAASEGRFTFHDPLTDVPPTAALAPNGLHDNSASYIVAGWWSDLTLDPLGALAGFRALALRLDKYGWLLDDDALPEVTAEDRARRDSTNASVGLFSPSDGVRVEYATGVGPAITKGILGVSTGLASPVKNASHTILAVPQVEFATMLHGAVFGVPTSGNGGGADDRPRTEDVAIALGQDADDVVSAFSVRALNPTDAERDAAERLTAAFTSDLLDRIASADGIADLAEHEHSDGFDSRPGPAVPGTRVDRFISTDSTDGNPLSIGRKGRGANAQSPELTSTVLNWADSIKFGEKGKFTKKMTGDRGDAPAPRQPSTTSAPAVREVKRPAPREFFPQAPMIALRGARPNLRHLGDGRFEDSGGLRCRYAAECVSELSGVLRGVDVLPTLGSGAIPEEVLVIARECVLLDPYGMPWMTAEATRGLPAEYSRSVITRVTGEMTRLYGVDAKYDGSSHIEDPRRGAPIGSWNNVSADAIRTDREITAQFAAHSIVKGTPPSPVAITTWRQPWVPLWIEWQVQLDGSGTMDGWRLGSFDFERDSTTPASSISRTITGRTPLSTGVAQAMHAGIKRMMEAEEQRDNVRVGVINEADERALDALGDFLAPLDLVSASMDGVREQLLGINYVGQMPFGPPVNGVEPKPIASALPVPMFGGTMRLLAMRLVDGFGRVLSLDTTRITTTRSLEVAGVPNAIMLRPRVQHAARWVVRFVGAADPAATDGTAAPDACVDQITPEAMINPVAGFLLPDHIDESLEVFATDGTPIGELSHDAITGAVMWETAPGRPIPPDAGPFAGLSATQTPIADVAAGVLLADVAGRAIVGSLGTSALTAMLRAIDTTLWTIDTYAALGSPSIAGLMGRPVAVVRATIKLEVPHDSNEVSIAHIGGAAARQAVFAAVADMRLPFRLGALERSDDALLGFYVGNDFTHLHLVDKVVQSQATASGRLTGALGQLGAVIDLTAVPLTHPYIVAEDELWIHPCQTIALTLLMLPAGRVHVTSGLLPRKALSLAEDWVRVGLKTMSPSVRVGPVLVDPTEIRLPMIRAMGPRQRFTRRTGPLTWRDDPITSATQAAYLPRMPHEAQEGWVRVAPADDAETSGGGAA